MLCQPIHGLLARHWSMPQRFNRLPLSNFSFIPIKVFSTRTNCLNKPGRYRASRIYSMLRKDSAEILDHYSTNVLLSSFRLFMTDNRPKRCIDQGRNTTVILPTSYSEAARESLVNNCTAHVFQPSLSFVNACQLTSGFHSVIHGGISLAGIGLAMP